MLWRKLSLVHSSQDMTWSSLSLNSAISHTLVESVSDYIRETDELANYTCNT